VRGRGGEGSVEAKVGAVEEGGELGEAEGEAFGGGGAEGKARQDGEVNSPLQLARLRL